MNILQINRNYSSGGAAVVARRLHNALNELQGVSSVILCRNASGNSNESLFELYPKLTGRIKSVLIDKFEQLTGCQYHFQKKIGSISDLEVFKNADVVHFHITHGGYIDQNLVVEVAKLKPVVWTFHDMWTLTGRCAHSYDCDKWTTGCGSCPNTGTYPIQFIDRSSYLWKLKKELYSNIQVNIISPSSWLRNKIMKSIVSHWPCTTIPNAVDLTVFRYNKNQSENIRNKLNIPLKRKIFLFVAHGGIDNNYKGFNILKDALKEIQNSNDNPYLLVIGGSDKRNLNYLGISGKSIGVITDEILLADYYTASDFYLIPSVQENLPLTIMESLGCGTPVIAFDVGGIPEMLKHKVTGYLAEGTSKEFFVKGINWACNMNDEEYFKSSVACRKFAEDNYSIELFVEKHMKVYKNSINDNIV
jgi:glycosyltransferase involved in cell wall biosynthesis